MHAMRVASFLHTLQVMALGNPCCLPRGEKRRKQTHTHTHTDTHTP